MNLCLAGLQGELLLQTSVQCRGDFWRTETYLHHPAFAFTLNSFLYLLPKEICKTMPQI